MALETAQETVRWARDAGVDAASEPRSGAAALEATRTRTMALVAHLPDDELERPHSPIMSPLAWDLAHIAAYEDLWLCQRHGGRELRHPELARLYDAFETPRPMRASRSAGFLGAAQARAYLEEVRACSLAALEEVGVGDGKVLELVIRHELQHTETMRQTMRLAGLLPSGEPPRLTAPAARGGGGDDADWAVVDEGPFEIGAGPDGFAYDNERPRHVVDVAAFAIATRPLRNADWLRFRDAGGYERPELWSETGWSWRRERPSVGEERARRSRPDDCLLHISWHEASAIARERGARLPTEAEWEKAANSGVLVGTGLAWEWTSSEFGGYPGFRADPYREYSEVFFDRGYRVLRGSSWATAPRVATSTFRNWDLPERQQIFAGARLARDLQR